jgi:hypothetical protein
LHIQFKEEISAKVPVLQVNRYPERTDYEDFIIEFKRLLEQYPKPRRKKQLPIVPTDLVLIYLIRHGATISLTGDKSLSRKATVMPHGTIRNPKPHSLALPDSSLL